MSLVDALFLMLMLGRARNKEVLAKNWFLKEKSIRTPHPLRLPQKYNIYLRARSTKADYYYAALYNM